MAGYTIREHQLVESIITYTDIEIIAKTSDFDFTIRPDGMKKQNITLCSISLVDWQQKDELKDWTFEQRKGCKRVIAYHKYPKGEQLNVQMR